MSLLYKLFKYSLWSSSSQKQNKNIIIVKEIILNIVFICIFILESSEDHLTAIFFLKKFPHCGSGEEITSSDWRDSTPPLL